MFCSVIVCTRDRPAQLSALLTSFCALAVPPGLAWEIVLVDNGERAKASAVASVFSDRLPIRLVEEPVAGLSRARNTGVAHARGLYIVWTDDDVLVDQQWLAGYVAAFRRHPAGVVFGGKIEPLLEAPTPAWFDENRPNLGFLLAARDFGPEPLPLSTQEDRIPYGASFAIRAAEQRAFPYDIDLGVAPGRRRGGEETAVIKALLEAGHEGWWVPEARATHVIPAARQTEAYVRLFYASMGEAWAHAGGAQRLIGPTLAKVVAAYVRLKVAEALNLRSRVRYLTSFAYHYGVFSYLRS